MTDGHQPSSEQVMQVTQSTANQQQGEEVNTSPIYI